MMSVAHLFPSQNPYRSFALICLSLVCSFFLNAQVEPLRVKFNLIVNDGSKAGAKVVIERDGKKWKQKDGEDGRGYVDLDYQHEYVLSFSKPGFITKKIAVSTKLPQKVLKDGFEPLIFDVTIFKQYDGVNIVIFNQPVARYAFLQEKDDFGYDTDYTKTILSEIKKVEDELKVKHKEDKSPAEKANKHASESDGGAVGSGSQDNTKKSNQEADGGAAQSNTNRKKGYRGMINSRVDQERKPDLSSADIMADSHIEREYVEGNKRVIETTVKREGKTFVYKKVIYVWGVYYFRDGLSITESSYIQEVL
jgi:hypothetical protein